MSRSEQRGRTPIGSSSSKPMSTSHYEGVTFIPATRTPEENKSTAVAEANQQGQLMRAKLFTFAVDEPLPTETSVETASTGVASGDPQAPRENARRMRRKISRPPASRVVDALLHGESLASASEAEMNIPLGGYNRSEESSKMDVSAAESSVQRVMRSRSNIRSISGARLKRGPKKSGVADEASNKHHRTGLPPVSPAETKTYKCEVLIPLGEPPASGGSASAGPSPTLLPQRGRSDRRQCSSAQPSAPTSIESELAKQRASAELPQRPQHTTISSSNNKNSAEGGTGSPQKRVQPKRASSMGLQSVYRCRSKSPFKAKNFDQHVHERSIAICRSIAAEYRELCKDAGSAPKQQLLDALRGSDGTSGGDAREKADFPVKTEPSAVDQEQRAIQAILEECQQLRAVKRIRQRLSDRKRAVNDAVCAFSSICDRVTQSEEEKRNSEQRVERSSTTHAKNHVQTQQISDAEPQGNAEKRVVEEAESVWKSLRQMQTSVADLLLELASLSREARRPLGSFRQPRQQQPAGENSPSVGRAPSAFSATSNESDISVAGGKSVAMYVRDELSRQEKMFGARLIAMSEYVQRRLQNKNLRDAVMCMQSSMSSTSRSAHERRGERRPNGVRETASTCESLLPLPQNEFVAWLCRSPLMLGLGGAEEAADMRQHLEPLKDAPGTATATFAGGDAMDNDSVNTTSSPKRTPAISSLYATPISQMRSGGEDGLTSSTLKPHQQSGWSSPNGRTSGTSERSEATRSTTERTENSQDASGSVNHAHHRQNKAAGSNVASGAKRNAVSVALQFDDGETEERQLVGQHEPTVSEERLRTRSDEVEQPPLRPAQRNTPSKTRPASRNRSSSFVPPSNPQRQRLLEDACRTWVSIHRAHTSPLLSDATSIPINSRKKSIPRCAPEAADAGARSRSGIAIELEGSQRSDDNEDWANTIFSSSMWQLSPSSSHFQSEEAPKQEVEEVESVADAERRADSAELHVEERGDTELITTTVLSSLSASTTSVDADVEPTTIEVEQSYSSSHYVSAALLLQRFWRCVLARTAYKKRQQERAQSIATEKERIVFLVSVAKVQRRWRERAAATRLKFAAASSTPPQQRSCEVNSEQSAVCAPPMDSPSQVSARAEARDSELVRTNRALHHRFQKLKEQRQQLQGSSRSEQSNSTQRTRDTTPATQSENNVLKSVAPPPIPNLKLHLHSLSNYYPETLMLDPDYNNFEVQQLHTILSAPREVQYAVASVLGLPLQSDSGSPDAASSSEDGGKRGARQMKDEEVRLSKMHASLLLPYQGWSLTHRLWKRIQTGAVTYAWRMLFSHSPHDCVKRNRLLNNEQELMQRDLRVWQRNMMILACYNVRTEREWIEEATKDLLFVSKIWNPRKYLFLLGSKRRERALRRCKEKMLERRQKRGSDVDPSSSSSSPSSPVNNVVTANARTEEADITNFADDDRAGEEEDDREDENDGSGATEETCREVFDFVSGFLFQCFPTVTALEDLPSFLVCCGVYFSMKEGISYSANHCTWASKRLEDAKQRLSESKKAALTTLKLPGREEQRSNETSVRISAPSTLSYADLLSQAGLERFRRVEASLRSLWPQAQPVDTTSADVREGIVAPSCERSDNQRGGGSNDKDHLNNLWLCRLHNVRRLDELCGMIRCRRAESATSTPGAAAAAAAERENSEKNVCRTEAFAHNLLETDEDSDDSPNSLQLLWVPSLVSESEEGYWDPSVSPKLELILYFPPGAFVGLCENVCRLLLGRSFSLGECEDYDYTL